MVEHELAGGECSYWACMPSKALLRPWAALAAARSVPGVPAGERLNPTEVLASRDAFASNWRDDGQVDWLNSSGAVYLRGHGRLAGERRVDVASRDGELVELTANHAVIVNAGSRALIPDIPGLAGTDPWTNREGTSARAVPDSLVIVGGGPVGAELATAWAALGADVTLLARGERLLRHMEPFAGELVGDGLAELGVDVRTGTSATRVHRSSDRRGVFVETEAGDEINADEILVATGREPRTDELGVDTVGLRPGEWLAADDTGAVTGLDGDWLYAIGDISGRSLLTHQGKYQARQTGSAIVARSQGERVQATRWGRFSATADHVAVPQALFTHPEVAAVGCTAARADQAGEQITTIDYDLGKVAGAALHADKYQGHARFVIDQARDVVVGATFAGPDVAELLHAATVTIVGEVPLHRLWHAVPAYPTISEVWLRLLEAYESRGGR